MQTQEFREKLIRIADEISLFPEAEQQVMMNDLLDNWEWNKRYNDPRSKKVLDFLAEEALAEFRAGKTKDLKTFMIRISIQKRQNTSSAKIGKSPLRKV